MRYNKIKITLSTRNVRLEMEMESKTWRNMLFATMTIIGVTFVGDVTDSAKRCKVLGSIGRYESRRRR